MGIVAPPCTDQNFDGRLFLHRVAIETECKKTVSHQRFSQSGEINEDLKKKEGGWKNNILGARVVEVKDMLKGIFSLDDFVSSRLTFVYATHKKKRNGSWKQKRMTIGAGNEMLLEGRESIDSQREGRELILNDLYIEVRCEKGDKRYEDVSCD